MKFMKVFFHFCLAILLGVTMSFGFVPPQANIMTQLMPSDEVVVTWGAAPDGFFEDFDLEIAPGFEWVGNNKPVAFEDSFARIVAEEDWVSGLYVDESFRDLSAEVTFENVSGTSSRGLLFRADGSIRDNGDMYALWVSYTDGGAWSLWRYCASGACAIQPWTRSDLIKQNTGDSNTLSVFASGSDLDLYINGNYIATVHDLGLEAGHTGVAVAPGSEVWVDDLCCYHGSVPPSAGAIPCGGSPVSQPLDDRGEIVEQLV